ncbi:hypothetical protein Vadar_026528 [Vaccinium darrowii]|uniref:Uncharacterized protein n=1 Tax=Vaccinium darrowii TaxID=229202 RepID=A0ACB7Z6G1_9ERIC|nr:hypothetical protein Vadar_026528 [Vaccinium darrowii]
MRPSFLLSFLLLSTVIISEVQAIRLEKDFPSVKHHKIQEGITVNKESSGAIIGEDIQCKEGQCTLSGKNRKLIAKEKSISPTKISKNETNGGKLSTDELGGKHERSYIDSSPDSNDHQEATPERYPEILDIDEMDYSQARRKPPIHN